MVANPRSQAGGPVLATLPFYEIPPLELGPLKFYPFGFLVGLAIIFGSHIGTRRARLDGLSEQMIAELALWAVIPGMIGAHLYSAVFYFPERIFEDPLYLLKIWDGISSFGGFLGGAAGVIYYLKKNKLDVWAYGDEVVWGLTYGFMFGRMGCAVAYDHPGKLTDFFLGMDYPGHGSIAAGARHNLGLYEMLWIMVMCAVLHYFWKKPRFSGWAVAVVLIMYTPARFLFDFFRVADKTYYGFTPGHLAAVCLFITGIVLYRWRARVGELVIPDGQPHVFSDGSLAIALPKKSKKKRK
jgi:phosphatidylglycerol:prolipoprotein diacylglycerol transferase